MGEAKKTEKNGRVNGDGEIQSERERANARSRVEIDRRIRPLMFVKKGGGRGRSLRKKGVLVELFEDSNFGRGIRWARGRRL